MSLPTWIRRLDLREELRADEREQMRRDVPPWLFFVVVAIAVLIVAATSGPVPA